MDPRTTPLAPSRAGCGRAGRAPTARGGRATLDRGRPIRAGPVSRRRGERRQEPRDKAKRWDEVARIRRRQAAALFEEAGGSAPPADEIVALHREGVAATLRALAMVSREAELVGASCCHTCRTDNDRIFRIADELRTPRLPHAGCPRGLCACDWWPAVRDPATKRRRRRRTTASPAAAVAAADTAAMSADQATSPSDVAEDNGAEVVAAGQPPRRPT